MTKGGGYEFLFYLPAVSFGPKFNSEKLAAVASAAFDDLPEF